MTERLSKGFYLGSLAAAIGFLFLAGLAAGAADPYGSGDVPPGLLGLSVIALLFLVPVMLSFWYRAWASIQDGHARTTPGRAVGFLFIPLYNFYWVFQLAWGFSVDYNAYVHRHGVECERLPQGLFLWFCILGLASNIPVLGVLAGLANVIVTFVVISKVCDAVNLLPAEAAQAAAA